MNSWKQLLLAFFGLLIIVSCQKEIDFQLDSTAHGTLKADGSGNCLPAAVNGNFIEDSTLSNNHFIDVQVNLSSVGTYDIYTDTVNGYFFRGTGSFGVSGLNMVRLYGQGKPVNSGIDIFMLRFDSSFCMISVDVLPAGTSAANYSLGGAPGNCTGAVVSGNYTAGISLGTANTVSLNVNVTVLGAYNISVASINGMNFSASGVFTTIGPQTVTLNGIGMPLVDGTFNASASTGTESCTFSIIVQPGAGNAVFTLNGAPGNCTGAVVAGTYTTGTALTASNTLTMGVNVVTPGPYSISTTSSNGITFTGSGIFTTAGPQNVVLTAAGTPTTSGTSNYTVTAGTSTCIVSITVNPGAPATNLDYIPQTTNSNWSQKLVGGTATDTGYLKVSANNYSALGNSYRIFEYLDNNAPYDSVFYRKNGGLYYSLYENFDLFDNPVTFDLLVLDTTVAANTTWNTNLGTNAVNGVSGSTKIISRIISRANTVTIAGNTYSNVIKVIHTYSINPGSGDVNLISDELWFAKGKGLIREHVIVIPNSTSTTLETTRTEIF